jgi:drug/metabolite transporter (DMT)-like permease
MGKRMKRFGTNSIAPLLVMIAAALWGVDGILLRPSLYHLPVAIVVLVETALAGLILTPFFIKKLNILNTLKPKDWLAFLGAAILGGVVGTMSITKALFYVDYVNLSIVVLIQKLQPVFAISLAAILLKEKVTPKFIFLALLAIGGAYLMTFGFGAPNINNTDKTGIAALLALTATFGFSSSTVLSKRALKNVPSYFGSYLRTILTALLMMGVVLFNSEQGRLADINQAEFSIFILIVLSTGGPAIFLYYYGLKKVSASLATICELAFPLTAVLLDYWVRGNNMNLIQWIGVMVLMVSILRISFLNSNEKIQKN